MTPAADMYQTTSSPVAPLRQTRSARASPSRSPIPASAQPRPAPRFAGNVALPIVAGEPISQIATCPVAASSHTTSEMPSPFTSPVPIGCQLVGTPGGNAAVNSVAAGPVNCQMAFVPSLLRQNTSHCRSLPATMDMVAESGNPT